MLAVNGLWLNIFLTLILQSVIRGSVQNFSPELDDNAAAIFHDSKDNYWFASRDKGVYKYDGQKLYLYTQDDGICNYFILSVQEDKKGNLYFDTPECILKFDGKNFTPLQPYQGMSELNDWKIEEGDLWFRMGWDHSGPFRYDGNTLYALTLPKNPYEAEFNKKYPDVSFNIYGLYTLFVDSKGNLWMGTGSLGLYMFDGENMYWYYEDQLTETPNGGAFGIRSIVEDHEGQYWICNANYSYTVSTDQSKNKSLNDLMLIPQKEIEGREDLYFLSIIPDEKGNLWMQTYDEGLWILKQNKLERFYIEYNEELISPSSMYKDKIGTMWLATKSKGIFTYDAGKIEKFNPILK